MNNPKAFLEGLIVNEALSKTASFEKLAEMPSYLKGITLPELLINTLTYPLAPDDGRFNRSLYALPKDPHWGPKWDAKLRNTQPKNKSVPGNPPVNKTTGLYLGGPLPQGPPPTYDENSPEHWLKPVIIKPPPSQPRPKSTPRIPLGPRLPPEVEND